MDRSSPRFLAAHKKIFFLLDVVHSMGFRLFFINSAPDMGEFKSEQITKLKLSDEVSIPAMMPTTYKKTRWGRLKNIQQSTGLIDRAANTFAKPDIVWCYNAYAFEMRAARHAENQFGSKIILEFEDWHFSRSSFFNPKAILDWFFWRRCLKSISYCYAVNEWLKNKMEEHGVPCTFLPGILTDDMLNLNHNCPPFKHVPRSDLVRCGYFGGLSIEKGAGRVLELIKSSIEKKLPIAWYVTGIGEFEDEFLRLSTQYTDTINFYGLVSDSKLSSIVGLVDVILNPHEYMPGVFPFKVLESVATGRLVLSTPVRFPSEFDWLSTSICIQPYQPKKWLEIIVDSPNLYIGTQIEIKNAYHVAKLEYGFEGVLSKLNTVFRLLSRKNKRFR
jgi:glycosyltransferase involved in cell wall biosynthesis